MSTQTNNWHPNPDYYEAMETDYLTTCDLCHHERLLTDVEPMNHVDYSHSIMVCSSCWEHLAKGETIQPRGGRHV